MQNFITLTTDFGEKDPYVASLKGMVKSTGEIQVLDLTHEIQRHNILQGAFFLWSSIPVTDNRLANDGQGEHFSSEPPYPISPKKPFIAA